MTKWPVMKLCERQLRDINPSDVLNGGLFRRCDTHKGGGAYDQFPEIYRKRFPGEMPVNEQFVAQLRGCPFNCAYCCVTRDGVQDGDCVMVTTEFMVDQFRASGLPVFHLMGGAPDIYLNMWPELLQNLEGTGAVFHSDFLLAERLYDDDVLDMVSEYPYQLHAVSIKGTPATLQRNTGAQPSIAAMLNNFEKLVSNRIPFYVTFTSMSKSEETWWRELLAYEFGESVLRDSFSIKVQHYKALDN